MMTPRATDSDAAAGAPMRWFTGFAVLLTLIMGHAQAWADPQRLALVVGNATYTTFPKLVNSVNDGRDMAAALRGLHFDVVEATDVTLPGFNQALARLIAKVRPDDVVVIFYAGHGMMGLTSETSNDFDNYLVPVDATLTTPQKVSTGSLALHTILDALERARAGPRLVILDACRDNPLAPDWADYASERPPTTGLMQPSSAALKDVYIAFATSPGKRAGDNQDGKNGAFTEEVLRRIATPGITVNALFEAVASAVEQKTATRPPAQTPWFAAGGGSAANLVLNPVAGAPAPTADPMTLDLGLVRQAQECGLAICLEGAAAEVRSETIRDALSLRARSLRLAARQYFPPSPPGPLPAPPTLDERQLGADARRFLAANRGTLSGWTAIGDALMSGGEGFVRDEQTAMRWYRAAGLAGSGAAAFAVGSALHKGMAGIPANPSEAYHWFQRAADRNHPQALGLLGEYNARGLGGRAASAPEAYTWFLQGFAFGDAYSTRRLADFTFDGTGGQPRDPLKAQALYRKAADLGDPEAMMRVSDFISFSRNDPVSGLYGTPQQAQAWLMKAAESGYLDAYDRIALNYHLGQGAPKDDIEALRWLSRAAERGSDGAMYSIAMAYAKGDYGLARDCHQAGRWLRRAEVAGSYFARLEAYSVAKSCESYQ